MLELTYWFKEKGWAFLRTFVAIAFPFIIQWLNDRSAVDWRVASSMIGMTLVLFVVTSLRDIPVPGSAPAWQILLWRFLRQLGQVLGASIGTAVLLTDVTWGPLLLTAVVSAFSSVILGSFVVQPGQATAVLVTDAAFQPNRSRILGLRNFPSRSTSRSMF